MKNIIDFEALRLSVASPETMRSWSHGEVLKPETINYRTLKPEKDGLFCERIFGPTKDWECYCGKYKRIRYRGIICDKCGVEVTQSRVRRERMGHISLASPVAHVWFFKGAPSKLSLLLNIPPRSLTGVIYFAKFVCLSVDNEEKIKVLDRLEANLQKKHQELEKDTKEKITQTEQKGVSSLAEIRQKIKTKEQRDLALSEQKLKTKQEIATIRENLAAEKATAEEIFKAIRSMVKKLKKRSILTEDEYLKLLDYDAVSHLKVGMGAEALLEIIKDINLDKLTAKLRLETKELTGARRLKATKRLRVVEGLKKAGVDPSWMIFRLVPVIPPDLRPMVQLSGGRFATSDLNDLYRRVLNRNNRLKHLIDLGAPEVILRNEKRMLQEAVDSLIDASQSRTQRRRRLRKELRSLSDMLRGKQGRFRQNLLGKRTDYSGRSVIVVGPELSLNQCGIPKEMALEMFKPYVLREVIKQGIAPNVKSAKHVLERHTPEVFDILEGIIHDHPVLLNRAPTLHKLGIQAFYPILIEGNAIRIHPCVCNGYNADFDGDQMAVHVPLGKVAREEAKSLMMPENNLLKPADGSPITVPNKEMALGSFYLTSLDKTRQLPTTIFSNPQEAIRAYQAKYITLRQEVKVRMRLKAKIAPTIVKTSVGRILFNEILPESLRFINQPVTAGAIKDLVRRSIATEGKAATTKLIDAIKKTGFQAATLSGISIAVSDCKIIPEKGELIEAANKKAETVEQNFKLGLITAEEKRRLVNEVWMDTTDEIADRTWENFEDENAVKMSIDSGGTRASKDQVKQLAAMRGLVVDPLGKIVEMPTKSNFREGLSIFEYVTSTRGSRKGLTDSALKTADAGYLTRRLIDVAHDAIVRSEDCGTKKGIEIEASGPRARSFAARILGRVAHKRIIHPKTKKVIVEGGGIIDDDHVKAIVVASVKSVSVRSPLTCENRYGLCATCYGWDFSTKKPIEIGTPAGVIAAQSIGEPGTQLTMRVKHAGGIVGLDVTQGLPRVEELFEARTPKNMSPLAEIGGTIDVEETDEGYQVTILSKTKPIEAKTYLIPLTSTLKVKKGDVVDPATQLASGSLELQELLKLKGLRPTQMYLLGEVQAVYESQGIPINDRHFEVIIRKMSDKVLIEEPGDTSLLPGELADKATFEEENEKILAEGGEPATAQVTLLGITRASLFTNSWLSSASFQETTNKLTDAASTGQVDHLLGLKENVIIGRLIPVSPERAMIKE
ncbi:MAG: DNA-directed RNA polymerase subunit beta' [Candidatus Chisholmbacteria bacterium]|nr:DNA-directed RNA polymerase subunit beta' [Candidatus Chisholmbacteria bacterium]